MAQNSERKTETPSIEVDVKEARKQGRSVLVPPNHPINALSRWRKLAILCTLSLAGYIGNLIIAIVMTAFGKMGEDLGVSPDKIANTIGYQLLGIAVGSLFWNPLSKSIGRRPVCLTGSFLFLLCCIWQALSKTFTSFVIARVITGIVSAWTQTLPATIVADIFIPEVRGSKLSLYAIAVVCAPTTASFFSSIITNHGSWRDIFWFCMGLGGLQLLLFIFFVPETLWVWDQPETTESPQESDHSTGYGTAKGIAVQQYGEDTKTTPSHLEHSKASTRRQGHVGAAWYPWTSPRLYLKTLIEPVAMVRFFVITLPSFYYGIVWAWSVGMTVVTSVILEEAPYHFATIPIGCAMLSMCIGGILGKWSGGIVADKTVSWFERRTGRREPEERLWALLPMFPLLLLGLLVFGACATYHWHWMGLLVTSAVYYFALSGTTGILQTYVMECYLSRSQDTQANFIFWKAIWGFAVAFFAMPWGEKQGWLTSYGIQGAILVGLGAALCSGLIWQGKSIRRWQGMPDFNAPI